MRVPFRCTLQRRGTRTLECPCWSGSTSTTLTSTISCRAGLSPLLSTSSSASTTAQRYSYCQYCQHLPQHQLLHQGTVTVSTLNIFLGINYRTQVQSLSVFSSSSSASTPARRYSHCQYSKHLPQHQLPHTGTVTVSILIIFLSINYCTKVE